LKTLGLCFVGKYQKCLSQTHEMRLETGQGAQKLRFAPTGAEKKPLQGGGTESCGFEG